MSNHSFSAKMADENTTSDSSVDSVDDSVDSIKGKTFRNHLNQKRKDASHANYQLFPGRAFHHQNPLVLIKKQDRASACPSPSWNFFERDKRENEWTYVFGWSVGWIVLWSFDRHKIFIQHLSNKRPTNVQHEDQMLDEMLDTFDLSLRGCFHNFP